MGAEEMGFQYLWRLWPTPSTKPSRVFIMNIPAQELSRFRLRNHPG
jgi:hypothetical protein